MKKQTTQGDPMEMDLNSQQDAQQRAHEWVVFLASDEANDSDRQRFEQWLALDNNHQTAYQQANAIWQATANLENLKALEPRFIKKPQNKLWSTITARFSIDMPQLQWAIAFSFAAIIGIAIMIQPSPEAPQALHYQTATAEKQLINLADGSEITLSPETHISVSYTQQQRQVTLHQGEAFFVVTKNPQRPFIVASHHSQVTVLGTRFNVNGNSYNTTVSVAEGKVQVESLAIPGYQDAETKLTAGQQVKVSETKGLGKTKIIDADNAGAWRRGVRIYEAQALRDVLRDLSRYHPAELIINDRALSLLPVTAVFPTNNVDQMLAALESVLPVEIVEINSQRIEVRAR